MMTSVFLCYAAAERPLAGRIAGFLERGADVGVFLEEGEMKPEEDVAQKAREGRMADIVLVLFSRDLWPRPRPRTQWEGAFIDEPNEEGVRIGFVKCDDCAPPRVIEPLFDLSSSESSGLRHVKRWIRTGRAERAAHISGLEALGVAIADRPGVWTEEDSALAVQFTRTFRDDFDEVCVLQCAERSTAALAGELAAKLELRLEGTLESNLDRLRTFCEARRFLIVLDGGCDELTFSGRCSTLITSGPACEVSSDPIREAQQVVGLGTAEWPEMCRHARNGRRLLAGAGRMAECYELMQQWHDTAAERNDRAALEESARELVWILQGWGLQEDANRWEELRVREYAEQMALF